MPLSQKKLYALIAFAINHWIEHAANAECEIGMNSLSIVLCLVWDISSEDEIFGICNCYY